jgi:glycerophosphoryl diester phosphodiesterase
MISDRFSTPPLVIGHRGVPSREAENSLASFRLAATPGPWRCDGVELDIHTTRDGHFLVLHNAHLSTGEAVPAHTMAELRTATDRASFPAPPTLPEALETMAEATGGRMFDVFVEAKELPPIADLELIAALRSVRGLRCHVHAFDHRIIARLHDRDPELSLGVLSCSYPVDPVAQVRAAGASTLWQESHLVDAELVSRCREMGIGVIAWTVNDREQAAGLAALGVRGLCGDWPERLRPAT